MTYSRWAHFTIPHTSLIEGSTVHSSVTLKHIVTSDNDNLDIQDCFIKAIGAYLAQQGVTPDQVKKMSQESIYDHLLDQEGKKVIENFLFAQGVIVSRWDVVSTDGHPLSIDISILEAKKRACETQNENSRPHIKVMD